MAESTAHGDNDIFLSIDDLPPIPENRNWEVSDSINDSRLNGNHRQTIRKICEYFSTNSGTHTLLIDTVGYTFSIRSSMSDRRMYPLLQIYHQKNQSWGFRFTWNTDDAGFIPESSPLHEEFSGTCEEIEPILQLFQDFVRETLNGEMELLEKQADGFRKALKIG